MGIVGTFGGYYLYRTLAGAMGGEEKMRLPAAAIAAWLSVVIASFICALELWVSDTTSLWTAITAMVARMKSHWSSRSPKGGAGGVNMPPIGDQTKIGMVKMKATQKRLRMSRTIDCMSPEP
jgi:hypothetical protein